MPTYAYLCKNCGEFETVQSIKDPLLKFCPKCKELGKEDVPPKKLISLSSFILKGGGWAKDSYK